MSPTQGLRFFTTINGRRPRRHRRLPELEGLERRVVLSPTTYTVDLTTDNGPTAAGSGSGTTGDLRYAINQADADPNPDGSLIQFDPTVFGTAQTITLSSSLGTLDLTETGGPEVIQGPSGGVTVSGGDAVGVFAIGSTGAPNVTATISGLTITGGSAGFFGGGGLDNYGTLSLNDCTVSANSAEGGGGGLFNNGGTLSLNDCTVSDNSGENGSGLNNSDGTLSLTGCTVSDNSGGLAGGGLNNNGGTLSLNDCTVSDNSAGGGGGISNGNGGEMTLTGCTVSDNSAGSFGGGGIDNGGTMTLTDCTISGNSAGDDGGGGLDNNSSGMLKLTDCTVSDNSGGGLNNNSGTLSLNDCTVSDNSGGGIDNVFLSTLSLTDCTVSDNSGVNYGGGIDNDGPLSLTGCTISANSATGTGGGLYNGAGPGFSGTATLTDTIVAGNAAGSSPSPSDVAGNAASGVTGTYNLIGTGGSGGITGGTDGNIVLTDLSALGLAPLGDYGGPTQTMALLPGSAAIGAGTTVDFPGTTNPITTDQRGVARPDYGPDIGAFQSQGFTITTVADSTPQITTAGTPFANALAVTVAANDPIEPVAGGIVTFTVPSAGASAVLSATTAVIKPGGQASATANANATPGGPYVVTASATGATAPASFDLTNASPIPVAFSGLTDQTITYGTASVAFTGAIAAGSQVPAGDTVAITLDGVTQQTLVGQDGSFATTFPTAALQASATAYTVTYTFAAQGHFGATFGSSQLTVDPVILTITANSLSIPYGGAVPTLTASYAGFVDGQTPADLTTPVVLSTSATSDSPAGAYAILVSGGSSPDYTIRYVDGTLTIAPPATPATSQARAAQGFVTSLYQDVLGRGAEPSGLRYWKRQFLGHLPSRVIWGLFGRSKERRHLEREGRAPTIPLGVAYADALRASRRAARQPMIAPAGTLALRRLSHARARTEGVLPHGDARLRVVGRP
jgi:hypothetical protein